MNVVLWIIAGLLAVLFIAAGGMKATMPKEKLAERMAWVEDFSPAAIKTIGVLEVLGGLGLVLPAILDIAPILVPIAATGLAVTMVGAVIVHVRRKEPQLIVPNVVLLVLALVVAIFRFGPNAF